MSDDFEDDYEQDFDEVEENQETEEPVEDEEVEFDEEEGFEDEDQEQDFDDDQDDDEDFDKPVAEGETVELEIEDLGSKGDGIARKEGFVIFVPGGEVGEAYDVEITSVGRKFAFGEIE